MNTALTAQPKSPRLIIGLRMRYEAAIYQVEIAPTTLNGLEGIDLLKPLNTQPSLDIQTSYRFLVLSRLDRTPTNLVISRTLQNIKSVQHTCNGRTRCQPT